MEQKGAHDRSARKMDPERSPRGRLTYPKNKNSIDRHHFQLTLRMNCPSARLRTQKGIGNGSGREQCTIYRSYLEFFETGADQPHNTG